jgi:hypothetical protein
VRPLDSTYRKLCRARQHAADVQQVLTGFASGDRYSVIGEPDGASTKLIFRVRGQCALPPHLSAALGDFLVNMRAALDHLAWALVPEDHWQKVNRPEKIKFPIYESDTGGDGQSHPARIRGVTDDEVLRAVDAVQPYAAVAPQTPERHPLWLLNKLCNIDKHRVLLVAVAAVQTAAIWWGSDSGDPSPTVSIRTEAVSGDEPIAWFDFGQHKAPAGFDPHLALTVRLNEPALGAYANRIELRPLMDIIYSHVEHFVIGEEFARFFGLPVRHGMTLDEGCDCPMPHGGGTSNPTMYR